MAMPTSKGPDDYQAECDHRTIQQAAEVLADKVRMKGVLRQHAKMNRAKAKMSSMLASYKMGKMGGDKDSKEDY